MALWAVLRGEGCPCRGMKEGVQQRYVTFPFGGISRLVELMQPLSSKISELVCVLIREKNLFSHSFRIDVSIGLP
jgi:hypothetical protein